jgi:hypothetical protein
MYLPTAKQLVLRFNELLSWTYAPRVPYLGFTTELLLGWRPDECYMYVT